MSGEQPDVSSNVSVDVDSAQRSLQEVAEMWTQDEILAQA